MTKEIFPNLLGDLNYARVCLWVQRFMWLCWAMNDVNCDDLGHVGGKGKRVANDVKQEVDSIYWVIFGSESESFSAELEKLEDVHGFWIRNSTFSSP